MIVEKVKCNAFYVLRIHENFFLVLNEAKLFIKKYLIFHHFVIKKFPGKYARNMHEIFVFYV